MLHAKEQAIDIDRHDTVPISEGEFLDPRRAICPRIGDHHVEPPVIRAHLRCRRLPIGFKRHIQLHVMRRCPQPGEHGGNLCRVRIGKIGEHHHRALGQQPLDRRKAYAAQCASYQRDAPFEPLHQAVFGSSPEMYLSIVRWNWRMRVS